MDIPKSKDKTLPPHVVRRFLSFFKGEFPENRCWEWPGSRYKNQYGQFGISTGRSNEGTHRMAYRIFTGPIPEGMKVLHDCDNKPCCNPKHLYAGTNKQNAADAMRRGRLATGIQRSIFCAKKLTLQDVTRIREMHSHGVRQKEIAPLFGVSQCHVSQIVNHKAW